MSANLSFQLYQTLFSFRHRLVIERSVLAVQRCIINIGVVMTFRQWIQSYRSVAVSSQTVVDRWPSGWTSLHLLYLHPQYSVPILHTFLNARLVAFYKSDECCWKITTSLSLSLSLALWRTLFSEKPRDSTDALPWTAEKVVFACCTWAAASGRKLHFTHYLFGPKGCRSALRVFGWHVNL